MDEGRETMDETKNSSLSSFQLFLYTLLRDHFIDRVNIGLG